jgi:hypothetical protein
VYYLGILSFFKRKKKCNQVLSKIKDAINEKIEKSEREKDECKIVPEYHGDYESNKRMRNYHNGFESGLLSALRIIDDLEGK